MGRQVQCTVVGLSQAGAALPPPPRRLSPARPAGATATPWRPRRRRAAPRPPAGAATSRRTGRPRQSAQHAAPAPRSAWGGGGGWDVGTVQLRAAGKARRSRTQEPHASLPEGPSRPQPTSPCCITRIWSASMIVDRRCATITVVRAARLAASDACARPVGRQSRRLWAGGHAGAALRCRPWQLHPGEACALARGTTQAPRKRRRPGPAGGRAWMRFSVIESSAEVASSRTRTGGSFRSARANATRCFSPPLRHGRERGCGVSGG